MIPGPWQVPGHEITFVSLPLLLGLATSRRPGCPFSSASPLLPSALLPPCTRLHPSFCPQSWRRFFLPPPRPLCCKVRFQALPEPQPSPEPEDHPSAHGTALQRSLFLCFVPKGPGVPVLPAVVTDPQVSCPGKRVSVFSPSRRPSPPVSAQEVPPVQVAIRS